MALKHLKDYYNKVCEDYKQSIDIIKDFEKEVEQGIVEPERVDKLKETLQPLLNNYQQISYIMFLLNQPNKKEKQDKYLKQNKKILDKIGIDNTTKKKLEENKEVLEKLKLL